MDPSGSFKLNHIAHPIIVSAAILGLALIVAALMVRDAMLQVSARIDNLANRASQTIPTEIVFRPGGSLRVESTTSFSGTPIPIRIEGSLSNASILPTVAK